MIARWKDTFQWKEVIYQKIQNIMKMKKKNEDEKNELFFLPHKNFHIHHTETSNPADFKHVTNFLISLMYKIVQPFKDGLKCPF